MQSTSWEAQAGIKIAGRHINNLRYADDTTLTAESEEELKSLLMKVKENGEGNDNPLQYSCLENPMDGGAWKAAVHGFAEGRTRLSDFTFTFHFHALEKEKATHSSVLAWRIPGTAEPGGLPSMGSHRVGHYWSDLAAAANGKEIHKRGDMCVCIADSLCCTAETNTTLESNYTPIKKKRRRKKVKDLSCFTFPSDKDS